MAERMRYDRVAKGSQIMFPTYPGLAIAVGLLFILQDPRRTSGGAFAVAKDLMPISTWGILFLVLGTVQVLALTLGNASVFRWTLVAGAGLCGFWGALILKSAYDNIWVSYTSGLWVIVVGIAHFASARSVSRDQVFRVPGP